MAFQVVLVAFHVFHSWEPVVATAFHVVSVAFQVFHSESQWCFRCFMKHVKYHHSHMKHCSNHCSKNETSETPPKPHETPSQPLALRMKHLENWLSEFNFRAKLNQNGTELSKTKYSIVFRGSKWAIWEILVSGVRVPLNYLSKKKCGSFKFILNKI